MVRKPRFLVLLLSLAFVALLAVVPGCSTTPGGAYVKADRATYEQLAPTLLGLVDGSIQLAEIDDQEKSLIHDTLSTWDARIRHAEQSATQPTSGP